MKKWQTLAAAAALAATALAGCSSSDDSAKTDDSATGDASKGSVYYLNFKPEADQAWQDLAKKYTEETGVPVKVVTAASNQYETTLQSEMGKSGAPTLFQVNGPVGLKNWEDYCYNLYGTDIYNDLTSDSYALYVGDKADKDVAAVAFAVESYGLIVNTELLEKAGYTTDDIKTFEDLKKVAEDITSRKDELGFAAFTSPGMDGSSDWRFKTHLANYPIYYEYVEEGIDPLVGEGEIKGTYLDNYRQIWDLYINNSTVDPTGLAAKTGDDSRNEFTDGQAVFYQNGVWEYPNLIDAGMTDDQLTMIPIAVGVDGEENKNMATGTENYWCVNKEASEDDIQATLAFMNWCATSDTGTTAMADEMGFTCPFKDAKTPKNKFSEVYVENVNNGKEDVAWSFSTIPSEEWKNGVGTALTQYAADPTDANWDAVVSAFVDGWKTESDLANK